MTSREINDIIRSWDSRDDMPYDSFGEKPIPYIGWFWRDVDFDSDHVYFGVLPIYEYPCDSNDKPRAGFMENNKWGYDTYRVEGKEWEKIKELIKIAVANPSYENLKAVDDAIQATLPLEYRRRLQR